MPERVLSGERFPEHHADGPNVGGRGRDRSVQPFRRDVGERARNVSERRQSVELGHLGQPEVQEADVDRAGLGEQHVRRLDVAVDDSAAVGVGERVADLRGDLDRRAVVELARAHRLAQRPARDVLVGDVDVRRVVCQRPDALAAWMAQRRRGSRFALGPMPRLALAGDDLQCDVEAGPLVPRQPDMAHPARAERADRPIPAEEEVVLNRGLRHVQGLTPRARRLLHRVVSDREALYARGVDGPHRRRHPLRFLRGRARYHGGSAAHAEPASEAGWQRASPAERSAPQPDASPATRSARRRTDRPARRLRAPPPIVHLDLEARHVRQLHGQGLRDRQELGRRRRGGHERSRHAGDQGARVEPEALGHRRAGAPERDGRLEARSAGHHPRRERAHDRVASAAREWHPGPCERVRQDHGLDEGKRRGRHPRRAGEPTARERCRLGGPLPSAVDRGAETARCGRRPGAAVRLRHRPGPPRHVVDDRPAEPDQLGGHRYDAERPARDRHRPDEGAPVRARALANPAEHDQRRQHQSRVRGHDRGLGQLPGGRDQGHPDDPAEGPDREDADDRPHQPRSAEDADVLEPRRGDVRTSCPRQRRREARAR